MADLVNGLGHGAKHGGENISKTACYVEKTITIKKRKVKSPFRFENMWLRVEGFIDKFKEWWQSYNFWGKPRFVLAKKLQALKCNLKKWNKEVIGNVSARKDVALEQLNHWDGLERLRPLSEEDRRSQRTARDEYSHFTILEETSWR